MRAASAEGSAKKGIGGQVSKMKFVIIAILIASLLLIGASGCQQIIQQTGQQAHNNTIIIKNFAFNPPELTINKGESVTWINKDPYPTVHTVSSDDHTSFNFKMIYDQNGTKRFDVAGEYPYHCSIHTSMKGKIIVK
jgi:plastocyanin